MAKPPLLSQFAAFLQAFDVVDDESVVRGVDTSWAIVRRHYPPRDATQRTYWSNAREGICRDLEKAQCSDAIVARALEQFDRGESPRLLSRQQKQQTLAWLRDADDLAIRFAAELWEVRTGGSGLMGITMNWIFGFLRRTLSEFLDQDYCRASGQYERKANELIDKAFALGLLVKSTENPRGHFDKLDAQSNPSFNFGPNVFLIGKLAVIFFAASPSKPVLPSESHRDQTGPAADTVEDDDYDVLW